MRIAFFVVLLLLRIGISNTSAQNNVVDSLVQILTKEKKDTNNVLALVQLSRIYLESKPDTALLLAQEGLTLAKHKKFPKGEALCLKAMGAVYGITGNYPKGLEALLKSLKLYESINDQQGMMTCYVTIGANYSHQEDYKQSLSYFFKAKTIAEDIRDNRYLMITLMNMGDSYEKINQLDSAGFLTQLVYDLSVQSDNSYIRGIALNNLGNIYSKMGKNDTAIKYFRQSLPDLVTENNDDALCEATIGIAKLFMKSSQADSALYYARKSLLVAEKSGFTKHILSAGDFLFTYYESIRLIDSAYAYQKISVAAKDSLFNQEKVRASQNLGFSEHMRQQEIIETAKIAAEERKNNIQIAALGVFIPVFLGIVLMLSKRNVKPGAMEFMGMLGVLMLFEFIALLIHPYIEKWTHHSPVLMLLILVVVASLLVPLHHKMEHWVKEELSNRRHKLLKPNDHAV